jgi:hypothetical protein
MMAILRIVWVTGSFSFFVQAPLFFEQGAMGWERHGGESPHNAAISILPAGLIGRWERNEIRRRW